MHSSASLQRPELSEKACVFASCNLFWLGNETFFKRKNVCMYVLENWTFYMKTF